MSTKLKHTIAKDVVENFFWKKGESFSSTSSAKERNITAKQEAVFKKFMKQGFLLIQDFVDKTDFNQFAQTGERRYDFRTNYNDKAEIFDCFIKGIRQRQQYTNSHWLYITYLGMTNDLSLFKVINGFDNGQTQDWPEERPQLYLSWNKHIDIVEKILDKYPEYETICSIYTRSL